MATSTTATATGLQQLQLLLHLVTMLLLLPLQPQEVSAVLHPCISHSFVDVPLVVSICHRYLLLDLDCSSIAHH